MAQLRQRGIAPVPGLFGRDVQDPGDSARSRGHHRDRVAEPQGVVDVVDDEERGDALAGADPLQLVLEPRAGERVEGAERLVEQEHARPVDEAAGNGMAARCAVPPESWRG
ncbi:hypothetical protein [Methylobacterium frigidaeris]|uniref:Uncharacterized protein n=1 Tax=Methylobacterium frigidaeris TaxID=2038277 RepID=A0AA37HG57_9HYPH|nr:hypothetical protein [Methylobacterium frigidaeris]GJD65285.1 hypothetical protein MPEAHAMD_5473 [Methylobacterium frigidaeris]